VRVAGGAQANGRIKVVYIAGCSGILQECVHIMGNCEDKGPGEQIVQRGIFYGNCVSV
jgi:hypothetical protein